MAILFTGDTHFGDPRVLRIDRRPFRSLEEHDATLIERWNEAVSPNDEVWHLGDFALGPPPERIQEILDALNGIKHLVVGNNDGPSTLSARGWTSIQHYAEMTVDGVHLVMCHYPFRTWNRMGRGVVDLHGHSHGKLTAVPRQFDVGVDVFNFRPANLTTILASRRTKAKEKTKAPASAAKERERK